MRPCRRCGRTDPHRMFALMTLWFGRFADLPLHGGYFYLCPACYEEHIAPHLAPVVESLAARQHDDEHEPDTAEPHTDSPDHGAPSADSSNHAERARAGDQSTDPPDHR